MPNPPELEPYEIKAFSAQDVAQMVKGARQDFAAEANLEDLGECVVCHVGKHVPVLRAQHFNDVGGPSTLMCEWCYVTGLIDSWMQEEAGSKQ